MATLSYFTDKLSAETRVLIYGFVFGSVTHVKRLTQDEHAAGAKQDERVILFDPPAQPEDVLAATSIFGTNKKISEEAIETFYHTKTLRMTFTQLSHDAEQHADYLNLVRKLDSTDCFNHFIFRPRSVIYSALETALQLPSIKRVTVLTEYLAYNPNHPSYRTGHDRSCFASVRDLVEALELGQLLCVDIGRYEIKDAEFEGLLFENSKLLKMWPNVKSMPDGFDGYLATCGTMDDWQLLAASSNIMAYASQTSFRVWVSLYESLLEWQDKGRPKVPYPLRDTEYYDRRAIAQYIKSRDPDATITPQGQHGRSVPLHKLGPQHDSDTLEWATELLAMNIEVFVFTAGTGTGCGNSIYMEIAKPYWPELEGGQGIGAQLASSRDERRDGACSSQMELASLERAVEKGICNAAEVQSRMEEFLHRAGGRRQAMVERYGGDIP